MSQACLPVFEIGLNALLGVLDKTAAFAAAKKIDPSVQLNWRLAPEHAHPLGAAHTVTDGIPVTARNRWDRSDARQPEDEHGSSTNRPRNASPGSLRLDVDDR
jgi:hypothetical protein